MEEKKIRLDLLHRLNTFHIHIPPLRERPEDIKPLMIHFVEVYALKFNKPNLHIDKEAIDILIKYDFPGNVRELKNMAERAIILCKGNSLGINDFPVTARQTFSTEQNGGSINLKTHEIDLIRKALKNCKYNQKAAADALGITRDALIRKMKKYDITISRIEE